MKVTSLKILKKCRFVRHVFRRFARNKTRFLFAAALVTVATLHATAMNHNLLGPWANPPRCSPPQTPLFAFFNRQNADFLFRDGGDKVEIWCQAGVRSPALSWSLHHNQLVKPFRTGEAEALPGNLFRIEIPTSGLKPGFYDVRVKIEGLGFDRLELFFDRKTGKAQKTPPTGICTFGWKPDEMPVVDADAYRPADFDAFWAEAMAEYRAVPLDLRVEDEPRTFKGAEIDRYNMESAVLPPDFDPEGAKFDEVVSCKVSFAGPDGGRVYAWMARPAAEGTYPALVVYPGAGTGGRPRPLDHARHGYVALDVQVHGLDVECDGKAQYPWYNAPSSAYPDAMPPPKALVWLNLYRRAARAVDAVAALPCADTNRIAVCGGSQGGRLSIVVAALDGRVRAAIPCIANSPDLPHLYWTRRCNAQTNWWCKAPVDAPLAEPVDGTDGYGRFDPSGTPEMKTLAYFDPINFAPKATCPAYFNGGLVDPVSPAYSTYAAYLRWGGKDKTFTAVPNHGHDWWPAFDRAAYRWLDKTMHNAECTRTMHGNSPRPPERLVLENAALRAEVVPAWGGRLMSFGRPGGANALWTEPSAATNTVDATGRPLWKNVGGEKAWVGAMSLWKGFKGEGAKSHWPPPAWFDSAPLGVVRADATNVLLRSAPHTSGDWIVALEREFRLLSDRLVLSERLLPLFTNDNGPHCSQIANANGNSDSSEVTLTLRHETGMPNVSEASEESPRSPRTPRDDQRRVWSVTQIPLVPRVRGRLCGEGRMVLERNGKPCFPAPVRRDDGWIELDLAAAWKNAKLDFDGDALAAPLADGSGDWLVIEQTADARRLGAFETPSRAIVYTTGGDQPHPYIELEFTALGPDAAQTLEFRLSPSDF